MSTTSITLELAKDLDNGIKFPFDFTIEYPEGQSLVAISLLSEEFNDNLTEAFAEAAWQVDDASLNAYDADETVIRPEPGNWTGEKTTVRADGDITMKDGIIVPVKLIFTYPTGHALTTIAMVQMLPTQRDNVLSTILTTNPDASILTAIGVI